MKVIFPKNINKWIFASMSFQVWPLTITVIQLFILALGVASALAIFNSVGQDSRMVGLVVAIPVFVLFVIIAFFKISELSLIPFLAKLMRTYFFDATKKFQVNFDKANTTELIIKKTKLKEKKQSITFKTDSNLNEKVLDDIQKGWLLG